MFVAVTPKAKSGTGLQLVLLGAVCTERRTQQDTWCKTTCVAETSRIGISTSERDVKPKRAHSSAANVQYFTPEGTRHTTSVWSPFLSTFHTRRNRTCFLSIKHTTTLATDPKHSPVSKHTVREQGNASK